MSEVFWIGGETLPHEQAKEQQDFSALFKRLLSRNGVNPSWVDEYHLSSRLDLEEKEVLFPSAAVHVWPPEGASGLWLFQSCCRAVMLGSSHLLAAAEEGQTGRSALLLASPRLVGMNNLLPEGSLQGFFSAGGADVNEHHKLNLLFDKLSQNGFVLDEFSRVTGSLLSTESENLLAEGFGERFVSSAVVGAVSLVNSLSAELSPAEKGLILQIRNGNMFSLVFERI